MQITKEIEQTETVTVVEDIICNKCGCSLKDSCNMNYEGLIEVSFCGGYASKIGDCIECKFSLCEICLIELFNTFKIKPYTNQIDELF